jgi:hypothetical protein
LSNEIRSGIIMREEEESKEQCWFEKWN